MSSLSADQRATLAGMSIELKCLETFLKPQVGESNLKAVLRVAKKLISGEGVTHMAKPGEAFRAGMPLTLDMDIEGIRLEAAQWLPYSKALGDACLDKGHGWALNHPLAKLVKFQQHVWATQHGVNIDESRSMQGGGAESDTDEDVLVSELAGTTKPPISPGPPPTTPCITAPAEAATPLWLKGAASALHELDANSVAQPDIASAAAASIDITGLSAKQLGELARQKKKQEAEARAAEKAERQAEQEAARRRKEEEKARLAAERVAKQQEKARLAAERAAKQQEKAARALEKAAAEGAVVYVLTSAYNGDAASRCASLTHTTHGVYCSKRQAIEQAEAIIEAKWRDGLWRTEPELFEEIVDNRETVGDAGVVLKVVESRRHMTVSIEKQSVVPLPTPPPLPTRLPSAPTSMEASPPPAAPASPCVAELE